MTRTDNDTWDLASSVGGDRHNDRHRPGVG